MYSDIADHASVPVNSRSHSRFSTEESSRVVVRCHNIATGTAKARTLDIAKSAVLGVSKPRPQVNTRPARPHRLSATEIAATQRGTVGRGNVEFIGSPTSQSMPFLSCFHSALAHRGAGNGSPMGFAKRRRSAFQELRPDSSPTIASGYLARIGCNPR